MHSILRPSFLFVLLSGVLSLIAFGQLPPVKVDPLHVPQGSPVTPACSATETSSCAEAAGKLLPLILGDSPMIENLRRLTDEIGGRVSGSPEMAKAVQWGVAGFRAAGVDVHTEKYTMPVTWKEGATRLTITSPAASSVALNGAIDKIPQAVVAREDALKLARLVVANPGKVRVKLAMPNEIGGPVAQENVVGEIRGYKKPDEVVILGAHLDSWELGTGALDNGCNAALVMEAARAIKAIGLVPKRTIRFVLFTGEEQGTVGSFAYVKAHESELDKIRGVIIFDSGSGRVTGYSLGGRRDTEAGLRQILKLLDAWGATQHTSDASFGTDNFDFLLEGVPTFVANQEISNYLANYHAASDTFDKVDQRELKLNTVIAALTAWGIADRAEPLGKRLSRGELDALVKETGLDEQMKLLGYWEQWQSGTRGRKP